VSSSEQPSGGDRAGQLKRRSTQLAVEPGCVIQLIGHFRDEPWTYLVLSLDFERNRCALLQLNEGSRRFPRPAGAPHHENLQDLLDDLSSSKEGIHWRKLL